MTQYSHLPSAALVALDRDLAKQFFGIRDVAERLRFVQNQRANSASSPQLTLDRTWTVVHAALSEIKLTEVKLTGAAEDSAAPLRMVLVGGRPLHIEADSVVTILRPDLVPIVAEVLQALTDDEIRRACQAAFAHAADIESDSASVVRLTATIDQIKEFYQQAKQTNSAVAFAAWSTSRPC